MFFFLPVFFVSELKVLTVKLWPAAPAVDLILCCKNIPPISEASPLVRGAILDTVVLVTTVAHRRPLFEDTLYIVKLWAHRRQVHSLGFLGGGGYAI